MKKIYFPEAEFLDVMGKKSFKSFPPCYSQPTLLKDFTPAVSKLFCPGGGGGRGLGIKSVNRGDCE